MEQSGARVDGRGPTATRWTLALAYDAAMIALFLAYYVAPSRSLSLAFLTAAAAVVLYRLPSAVALAPLAMPFFMLPKHVGRLEFSLGETVIVVLVVATAARSLYRLAGGETIRPPLWLQDRSVRTLLALALLFLVAATVATVTAFERHVALRQYREVIVEPIVYALLVLAVLRTDRQMIAALAAVAAAGAIVAVLGLVQYLFQPDHLRGVVWSGTAAHPISTPLHLVASVYGSPDNVGLLLDRAIPVGLILTLLTAQSCLRRLTVLPALLLLGMSLTIVLSGSRGGMITAAVVTLTVAVLSAGDPGNERPNGRRRGPSGAVFGLVGACGAIVVALILWKVRHGLSNSARLLVWSSALKMIRNHPLLGIGPDNFLYYYIDPSLMGSPSIRALNSCIHGARLPATHYMNAAAWREPCLSHPHNIVLDAWLSTGLLGLLAIIGIVITVSWLSWRACRRSTTRLERAIVLAPCAIIVATIGHGLVDNALFLPDLAVDFWLAVALIARVSQGRSPDGSSGQRL